MLVEGDKTDAKAVKYASRAQYESLLGQGIEIAEYQPTMLHTKALIVDGVLSIVGSANFDMRSFHLNTEIGLIIDSPELARQAIARFEAITIPANSYAVKLATSLGDPVVHWVTEDNHKMVELDTEPGHAFLRELLVGAVSILPIDDQL